MKILFLSVLCAGLVAVSCKKNEEKSIETAKTETSAPTDSLSTKNIPLGDTTENAVDWDGTYEGTIPCASCPGIEMKLTLKNDKTYELTSVYQEEKEGKFEDKGTFEFSKDGSFITLKDAKDPKEEKVFFVTEGSVFMAEKVGDNSAKKEYKLTKK